jgi:hypothetical protein
VLGAAIGLGDLGVIGGGIAGVLVTIAVVVFYVLAFGRSGQYGYFLRESGVIVVVLALPTTLTGLLTAWLKDRLQSSSGGDGQIVTSRE